MLSSRQLLIASATLDVRLKSLKHFNFCFEPKKIGKVDQKSYFILKMEINKKKIRYILQYHYDKGKNAVQACEKICAIYGEDIYQNQQHGNGSLAFVEISM